jgi:hypothetical protein
MADWSFSRKNFWTATDDSKFLDRRTAVSFDFGLREADFTSEQGWYAEVAVAV